MSNTQQFTVVVERPVREEKYKARAKFVVRDENDVVAKGTVSISYDYSRTWFTSKMSTAEQGTMDVKPIECYKFDPNEPDDGFDQVVEEFMSMPEVSITMRAMDAFGAAATVTSMYSMGRGSWG